MFHQARKKETMQTPWGMADTVRHLDHGIIAVTTPSHGGYYVPPETRKKMPAPALTTWAGPGWYEEDCDWALVALSFPDLFPPAAIEHAKRTVEHWKTAEVCAAFGLTRKER